MKLYIEQGLPASGKTTHARKLVDNGNTARINYDDLRASMYSGKWSPTKEGMVQDAAKAMVRTLLMRGQNVVIDNTNLTQKHIDRWKTIANEHIGVTVEVIRHDTPLLTCIERDGERQASVGRPVIERMSLQAGWTVFDPADRLVIVDVDGTLADSAPAAAKFLKPHTHGDENNWKGFLAATEFMAPIHAVTKWVRNLPPDYKIIICSGRSDSAARTTISWLRRHDIPFDHILMRRNSDHRPDAQVKQEFLNLLPKQQIAFIIDDRNSVCEMWRRVKQEEGLSYSVYQVAEGDF